jgi:elongation factor Ts
MHIAASNPRWVSREEVTESDIEHEKQIYRDQMVESGKPENIIEKIVEGKMDKFYSESCLMEQGFIKDPDTTVSELLQSKIAEIGENMKVSRFARFEIGQS